MAEIHFLVEEAPEGGFTARAMGPLFLPRRTISTICTRRSVMWCIATSANASGPA